MSSIKSSVGQHLFVGITGRTFTPEMRALLERVQPGGVILFARNVGTADELRALTHAIHHEIASHPLIGIDLEGGRVNRLRDLIGELPKIPELKATGDPQGAGKLGRQIGGHLREFGIHIDFAPVFDLELFDDETDNALRERCWGRTADEVTTWAGAFLDGLQGAGVAGCGKHFPGLGASTQDSHEHLPTITRSKQELLTGDIEPYRRCADRLAAIMVSHGHFVAFDGEHPKPACLSRAIVTKLLRQELGFNGLVVTDDMEMGAITNFKTAASDALKAGADMLLICHTPDKLILAHEVLSKVKISAESFGRIERFRSKFLSF